jgi:predicted nucleic acid-binding protein
VALYLDTSCLAKLLFDEAESPRTVALIAAEARVAVSSLARLEAAVQIQGRVAGGSLTPRQGKQLLEKLTGIISRQPLELVADPPDVFAVAEKQVRDAPKPAHCPTLDRLHLAIMEALGFRRVLTNDDAQARAARALGFEAILPR